MLWAVTATIRTPRRVHGMALNAVQQEIAAHGCLARSSGVPGVCVRVQVQADDAAAAYVAGLGVLATEILPHLPGAELTDLTAGPAAGRTEWGELPRSA
ncbi:MAG TPA: hypothetical protein VLK55_06440 [Kocuria rosea]|jgi:hypothetical protein|nr:hypothetical protein [Kocuria rosea]